MIRRNLAHIVMVLLSPGIALAETPAEQALAIFPVCTVSMFPGFGEVVTDGLHGRGIA
jgi:hypothetical protein